MTKEQLPAKIIIGNNCYKLNEPIEYKDKDVIITYSLYGEWK